MLRWPGEGNPGAATSTPLAAAVRPVPQVCLFSCAVSRPWLSARMYGGCLACETKKSSCSTHPR